jgi:hypothetical protein
VPERDDHDEIIRIRERLHKLEGGHAITMQAVKRNEGILARLEPRLQRLEQSDAVDRAVSEMKHELRGELFSTWQKVGAGCVGIVALADFVRGIVMG